jgi:hypothetical protein
MSAYGEGVFGGVDVVLCASDAKPTPASASAGIMRTTSRGSDLVENLLAEMHAVIVCV